MHLIAGWQNSSGGGAALSEQPYDGIARTCAGGSNSLGHTMSLETEGDE
jgi:hypothetical protein